MKKVFLLLSLSFFLVSCGASTPESNTPQTPSPTKVGEGTYENDLKTASPQIKDSKEFKNCMDIQVPMCIQSAGMQIARETRSTDICQQLSDEDSRESCIFTVTLLKAQENGDVNLCNNLSTTYKNQCINAIVRANAAGTGDATLCNDLVTTESGSTTEKDMCIMNVAITNTESTKEACESIVSEPTKKNCERMIESRPTPPKTEKQ